MTPRKPIKSSSDDFYKEEGHSCLIPALLIAVAALVGGFFALKHFGIDLTKIFSREHEDVKIIDPSLNLDETKMKPKVVEKPKAEPEKVEETEPVEKPKPEPPKKTPAQLRAEAEVAQKSLDAEIAKAREANKRHALKGFAGVKFGQVMDGSPIKAEQLALSDDTNASSTALLMFGPTLKKPFRKFGNPPLVRVTPQTRRIFQMEFSQPIVRQPGWKFSEETTNLVAMLSQKLKIEPFSLDAEKYPFGNHTFVFPLGDTVLTVGEYGGERLKLTVENLSMHADVKAESAAMRKEELADDVLVKPLTSDKYPNSGLVKFGRVRVKSGTPKAFCGIVFGSLPPYSAKLSAPMSSNPSRQFYIDYRKSKCKPFMNFDHGQAEVSAINGAVIAVNLYSDGSDTNLSDEEFFLKAKSAIETRFKVQPASTEGTGPIQNLKYVVTDLTITLGPDPRGGFYLKAVNTALKEAW